MITVTFEQGNASPRIVRITTDATLAQVTAAGWYNNAAPNQLQPSDEVEIAYAQGTANANTAIFSVSISAGVVTLSIDSSSVVLPVVSGDFAVFSGTSGAIADLGYSPTNVTKAKVVMLDAAPTINHVAKFTAADGTVGDGGVLGTAAAKAASDNTKATLASVAAATTIGHVASFADVAGTVQDGGVLGQAAAKAASDNALSTLASTAGSGFTAGHVMTAADAAGSLSDGAVALSALQLSANIKAASTADIGGAGAGPISVVVAGLTAASKIVATIASSSNAVGVAKCIATATGFDITFTGDPGAACVVNYVAFVVGQ